jgi:hypothetical protein
VAGGQITGDTGTVKMLDKSCLTAPDCFSDRIDVIEPI